MAISLVEEHVVAWSKMARSRLNAAAVVAATVAAMGVGTAAPAAADEEWGSTARSRRRRTASGPRSPIATKATGGAWNVDHLHCLQHPDGLCRHGHHRPGLVRTDLHENGIWYVKRVVPNWKYCADGSRSRACRCISSIRSALKATWTHRRMSGPAMTRPPAPADRADATSGPRSGCRST